MYKAFILSLSALLLAGAGCLSTPTTSRNEPTPVPVEEQPEAPAETTPITPTESEPSEPVTMNAEDSSEIAALLVAIKTETKLPFSAVTDENFAWSLDTIAGKTIQATAVSENAASLVEAILLNKGFKADLRGNADGTFVGSTGWSRQNQICRVSTQLTLEYLANGEIKQDANGKVITKGANVQVHCGVSR